MGHVLYLLFRIPVIQFPHDMSGHKPTKYQLIVSIFYFRIQRLREFWCFTWQVREFIFARLPHLFLNLLIVRNQSTHIVVKPCRDFVPDFANFLDYFTVGIFYDFFVFHCLIPQQCDPVTIRLCRSL